ncbi:MAG TPA: hypothetical protein VD887_01145 [Allosphingosinicella sp.]|nr:hypothetical protein [Allosphingosinicella sp.]
MHTHHAFHSGACAIVIGWPAAGKAGQGFDEPGPNGQAEAEAMAAWSSRASESEGGETAFRRPPR